MLHNFAVDLAHAFYAGKEHTNDDIEIYAYGLEVFLATAIQLVALFTLAFIFGQTLATIAFLIGFTPLRLEAGGYHARTHLGCFCRFTLLYISFLIILQTLPVNLYSWMAIALVGCSFIPVLTLAPLPDENRPVGPKRLKISRRRSLKRFFICSTVIIVFSVVNLLGEGFLQQIFFALSFGQFAVALLLIAAKIRNTYKFRRAQT